MNARDSRRAGDAEVNSFEMVDSRHRVAGSPEKVDFLAGSKRPRVPKPRRTLFPDTPTTLMPRVANENLVVLLADKTSMTGTPLH